jgi:hypothetical protein
MVGPELGGCFCDLSSSFVLTKPCRFVGGSTSSIIIPMEVLLEYSHLDPCIFNLTCKTFHWEQPNAPNDIFLLEKRVVNTRDYQTWFAPMTYMSDSPHIFELLHDYSETSFNVLVINAFARIQFVGSSATNFVYLSKTPIA